MPGALLNSAIHPFDETAIVRGPDGNPVVHAHCVVALLRNGTVHAGHLLQGRVSLTMQMYLTDSEPLTAAATVAH